VTGWVLKRWWVISEKYYLTSLIFVHIWRHCKVCYLNGIYIILFYIYVEPCHSKFWWSCLLLQWYCVWSSVSAEQALDRAGCLNSINNPTMYVTFIMSSRAKKTLYNVLIILLLNNSQLMYWTIIRLCQNTTPCYSCSEWTSGYLYGQAVEWSWGEMTQVQWKILY
jgi:hypothetical protein